MKILIDIGHPAHVHLFKNFAFEMLGKRHEVLFTCREKEYEMELLNAFGFTFISFGAKKVGALRKLFGLFEFTFKEIIAAVRFQPDVILSHGSMYASYASFFIGKPHIAFEDTFNFEQIRLYKPFTKLILTGDYNHPLKSKKVIKYSGYHELAYLHPNRFEAKGLNIFEKEGKDIIIVRFVSWQASHDRGHSGISIENKIQIVRELSLYGEVIISSEATLPIELKEYQYKYPSVLMHHLLANARLLFTESGTMAAEAAVLGVPSIFIDNNHRLYTLDIEEKYDLCYNFTESSEDVGKALMKAIELLHDNNLKQKWVRKRARLLEDKIDVTAFLVWFVENYPQSLDVMKNNPDFQLTFK